MMNTMFVLLEAQGGQGGGSMLLWLVLIFVVMWLLMVRPQQKQAKKEREFLALAVASTVRCTKWQSTPLTWR